MKFRFFQWPLFIAISHLGRNCHSRICNKHIKEHRKKARPKLAINLIIKTVGHITICRFSFVMRFLMEKVRRIKINLSVYSRWVLHGDCVFTLGHEEQRQLSIRLPVRPIRDRMPYTRTQRHACADILLVLPQRARTIHSNCKSNRMCSNAMWLHCTHDICGEIYALYANVQSASLPFLSVVKKELSLKRSKYEYCEYEDTLMLIRNFFDLSEICL